MFGFTDPWLSDIFWHSAFTWNTLSYGCHGVDMAGQNFWPVEAGTCSFNLEHLHLFLSWFINSSNYMYLCAISTMPIQHHSPQTSNIIHNKHPTCTKPRVRRACHSIPTDPFLGAIETSPGSCWGDTYDPCTAPILPPPADANKPLRRQARAETSLDQDQWNWEIAVPKV